MKNRTCNAWSHKHKTQCTRGITHVDNAMPHRDNAGNTWPLTEKAKSFSHLPPKREFHAVVKQAVRRRLDRMPVRHDHEFKHTQLLALIPEALNAVLEEINEYRRLDGQLALKIEPSLRKLLVVKE